MAKRKLTEQELRVLNDLFPRLLALARVRQDGVVIQFGDQIDFDPSNEPIPLDQIDTTGLQVGDLLYFDGFSLTRLPVGGDGTVLTAQGPGEFPVWASPGGADFSIVEATDPVVPVAAGTDVVLCARSDTGVQTIQLPAGALTDNIIHIKDVQANASVNPITILPNGAETIQGQALYVITNDSESISLVFYQGDWVII